MLLGQRDLFDGSACRVRFKKSSHDKWTDWKSFVLLRTSPKQKQADSPPSPDKTFFAMVAEINRLVKHAEGCTKRSEVLHKQAVVAVNGVEMINAEIESREERL